MRYINTIHKNGASAMKNINIYNYLDNIVLMERSIKLSPEVKQNLISMSSSASSNMSGILGNLQGNGKVDILFKSIDALSTEVKKIRGSLMKEKIDPSIKATISNGNKLVKLGKFKSIIRSIQTFVNINIGEELLTKFKVAARVKLAKSFNRWEMVGTTLLVLGILFLRGSYLYAKEQNLLSEFPNWAGITSILAWLSDIFMWIIDNFQSIFLNNSLMGPLAIFFLVGAVAWIFFSKWAHKKYAIESYNSDDLASDSIFSLRRHVNIADYKVNSYIQEISDKTSASMGKYLGETMSMMEVIENN